MEKFINRIIRAAKLDVELYEEVEADKEALNQAMLVVILSGFAAGIGLLRIAPGGAGIVSGTIGALIGWFMWALLTYWIGAKLFPEPQTRSDLGELLRTIGFSSSPGLIRVLGIVPGLSGPIFLITSVWMLIAMVIAVRQALDYKSTWRAIGVCFAGWIIQVFIAGALIALMR